MTPLSLLRRIGSVPTILIMLGLLIGGVSACQAVSNYLDTASGAVSLMSGGLR